MTAPLRAVFAVVASLGAAAVSSARAQSFRVAPFVTLDGGEATSDEDGYARLIADLGVAVRPSLSGPARTEGAVGLSVGYELSHTGVDARASHWETATEGRADGGLDVSRLVLRKGLPGSLELGASFGVLGGADAWVGSLELKWAFVEGLANAPDVGARISLGALFGHPDLTLVTSGADLVVGKSFGLFGVLRATPWAGYAFTFTRGASRPVAVVGDGDVASIEVVVPSQNSVSHRGVVGLDVRFGPACLALEGAFGDLTTVTFRAALAL
ncbi:MAG: hypothetical protein H6745_27065 [Deltaproteobacteria bacterium]|nr:hypothetical protein [Deltaproteobacteria bacterium]